MSEDFASETFQSIEINGYQLKFITGHEPRKKTKMMLQHVWDDAKARQKRCMTTARPNPCRSFEHLKKKVAPPVLSSNKPEKTPMSKLQEFIFCIKQNPSKSSWGVQRGDSMFVFGEFKVKKTPKESETHMKCTTITTIPISKPRGLEFPQNLKSECNVLAGGRPRDPCRETHT